MGLPDDEMQKLTSPVTDRIPELSSPAAPSSSPPSQPPPTASRLQPCRVSSKTNFLRSLVKA
jgi:hypothetical protein